MNLIRRLIAGLIALSVLMAATGVVVVSAAFALYALVSPRLGPAGGAAVVMAVFSLILVLLALALAMSARGVGRAGPAQSQDLTDRFVDMAAKRPIIATLAAAAAGLVAWRNPGLASTLYRTFTSKVARKSR